MKQPTFNQNRLWCRQPSAPLLDNDRVIDPDILETKCQVILASVDRISRIIDHIRTFSRDQALYTPNGLTFMPRLTMRFR